jgi:guanine nucleotide-binding protein alpha-1 subunit
MTYARDAWNAERASWRSVIQLNLIRSILTILETLQAEMAGDRPEPNSPFPNGRHSPAISPRSSTIFTTGTASRDHIAQQSTSSNVSSILNGKHQLLQLRLGPLRRVETDLKKRFGPQADEDEEHPVPLGPLELDGEPEAIYKEFGVSRLTEALTNSLVSQKNTSDGKMATVDYVFDEVTEVIASCKDYMMALWSDPAVRAILKIWNVCLEDSAGL